MREQAHSVATSSATSAWLTTGESGTRVTQRMRQIAITGALLLAESINEPFGPEIETMGKMLVAMDTSFSLEGLVYFTEKFNCTGLGNVRSA